MPKSNFLLVDLNEPKTKKLAETITSDTSRKILNYLVEKEDTETNIAKILEIPISTVHYHLQKLQEAGLVTAKEFHYSRKGREVNHYKLANKYIIIAPRNVFGLKEKLRGILPVVGIMLGISAVIKLLQNYTSRTVFATKVVVANAEIAMESTALKAAPTLAQEAPIAVQQPDIAFWFFIGSVVTMAIYLLILVIKHWIKKE